MKGRGDLLVPSFEVGLRLVDNLPFQKNMAESDLPSVLLQCWCKPSPDLYAQAMILLPLRCETRLYHQNEV
jgi:hypothetical protein